MRTILAVAFVLVLLSAGSHAAFLEAPATVVVNGEQKEFSVIVWNDGLYEADYSLRLFGPFEAAVNPSSGVLAGESAVTSNITILNDDALEGSNFEARLEAKVGEVTIARDVRILFKSSGEEISSEGSGLISLAGFYGVAVSLFTAENLLNLVLAVVAAVLIIAFVARFIKRLEVRK